MNDHELAGELQKLYGRELDNTTILLKVVEGKLAAENVHEIRNTMQRMIGEISEAAEAERVTILAAFKEMAVEDFQQWLYTRCGLDERGMARTPSVGYKPLSDAIKDVDAASGRKDGDDAAGE